jgi:hypothetical protein
MSDHFFISYSSVDGIGFSLKLADELAAGPPPVPVWVDKRNLRPAEDWDEQIVEAIKTCKGRFLVAGCSEGFDQQTAWMIANTTLADLLRRNTATPNLQANVFLQADLPPHVRHHATAPAVIDTHGSRRQPFADDGT